MEDIENDGDNWFHDFENGNDTVQNASHHRINKPDKSLDQVSVSKYYSAKVNAYDDDKNNTASHDSELNIVNYEMSSQVQVKLKSLEEQVSYLHNKNLQYLKLQSKLESRIDDAINLIDDHTEYIRFLEKEVSRLDQYGRRENVEILGIPANIPDNKLEINVLQILKSIGMHHIEHFNIVACHRLGYPDKNRPRSVIIRFLNRKDAIKCLKYKRNINNCNELGFYNIHITENLCPSYRSIYENLSELKNEGKLKSLWSHNGVVNFKFTDNEREKSKIITHESDIDNFFLGVIK